MNEFLHTLSGVTYLTKPQFDRMKDSYNNKELFPYNNEKQVFCKYAKRGFRAEIIYTPYITRKGVRIWAYRYGLKAFRLCIPKDKYRR